MVRGLGSKPVTKILLILSASKERLFKRKFIKIVEPVVEPVVNH